MSSMRLFDTATKSYKSFEPDRHDPVGIYVCGITPYDSAHLGHIFTFMTYDLLQRRLEDDGHDVRMVRNITDVDEPIYARAAQLGIDYRELARNETAAFESVLSSLHFLPLYAQPLASQYIDQMASAVQQLLDADIAYRLGDDIYFDTATAPDYTTFSRFSPRVIEGLTKLRGGDPERRGKRQALDFLLWKGVIDPADPAQWSTGLGAGRPGWHIECSVMSSALLDLPLAIHGGGTDLIFPHHSSEIAQGQALGQSEIARFWVHVSPLLYDGEKMSKSLGNLVFAKDLLAEHEPAVIRLALMHYHHRVGGEWLPELLKEATKLWADLQEAAAHSHSKAKAILLQEVRAALDDDINTMEVIDALHRFVRASGEGGGVDIDPVLQLLGLKPSLAKSKS